MKRILELSLLCVILASCSGIQGGGVEHGSSPLLIVLEEHLRQCPGSRDLPHCITHGKQPSPAGYLETISDVGLKHCESDASGPPPYAYVSLVSSWNEETPHLEVMLFQVDGKGQHDHLYSLEQELGAWRIIQSSSFGELFPQTMCGFYSE